MDQLALYLNKSLFVVFKVTLSCYVKIDIGSAEHVIGMITDWRTERQKLESTLSRQVRKIKLSAQVSCELGGSKMMGKFQLIYKVYFVTVNLPKHN